MGAGLAAAIAGGVAGLGQIGFGIADRIKSNKLKKMSIEDYKKQIGFDDYTTPDSYEKMRDLIGLRSRQEMPGSEAMRQDIAQTTAAGLGAVGQVAQGADAMAGVLGLMQDRQRSLRQLGIAASQYQSQAQLQHAQAIGQGAQYEDKAFEYNQWLPGQMKANEVMGLRGAGNQGIVSGLDTIGAAGIQYGNMQAMDQWYNRMNQQDPYGWGSPGPYVPFQNQSINQLGQQQVQPAVNLGQDPYS